MNLHILRSTDQFLLLITVYHKKQQLSVFLIRTEENFKYWQERQAQYYDAVFMDIYTDGMDGVAAAQKIRDTDSRCVLVFLTSSPDTSSPDMGIVSPSNV